jgi:hypothetical protein
MSVVIKVSWQGKKFPVEYNSVQELKQATVKDLKEYCSRMTGIDSHKINLLAFGGKKKKKKKKKKREKKNI